jgi:hypothetical protein
MIEGVGMGACRVTNRCEVSYAETLTWTQLS